MKGRIGANKMSGSDLSSSVPSVAESVVLLLGDVVDRASALASSWLRLCRSVNSHEHDEGLIPIDRNEPPRPPRRPLEHDEAHVRLVAERGESLVVKRPEHRLRRGAFLAGTEQTRKEVHANSCIHSPNGDETTPRPRRQGQCPAFMDGLSITPHNGVIATIFSSP